MYGQPHVRRTALRSSCSATSPVQMHTYKHFQKRRLRSIASSSSEITSPCKRILTRGGDGPQLCNGHAASKTRRGVPLSSVKDGRHVWHRACPDASRTAQLPGCFHGGACATMHARWINGVHAMNTQRCGSRLNTLKCIGVTARRADVDPHRATCQLAPVLYCPPCAAVARRGGPKPREICVAAGCVRRGMCGAMHAVLVGGGALMQDAV